MINGETIDMRHLDYVAQELALYTFLGRALSPEDLWERLSPERRPEDGVSLYSILERLEESGFAERRGNHYAARHVHGGEDIVEKTLRRNRVMKEKWQKLLKYREYFSWIPFVDFVLVSGSLAYGTADEDSDFDVIVGCKAGRIFTARWCAVLLFGVLGIRRRGKDPKKKGKDKVCFNHFVTPHGYRLMGPYTPMWHEIYEHLVPFYGDEEKIIAFVRANNWVSRKTIVFDNRHLQRTRNRVRDDIEKTLKRKLGDGVERLLKKIQLTRINKKRSTAEGVRVYCSDEELEFHTREPEFRALWEKVEKHLTLFGISSMI